MRPSLMPASHSLPGQGRQGNGVAQQSTVRTALKLSNRRKLVLLDRIELCESQVNQWLDGRFATA